MAVKTSIKVKELKKREFLEISSRVKEGLNKRKITEQDILKDFELKREQKQVTTL